MGQKLKTPKGEIGITNCQGRIRLRWRHLGNRYSLNLPFAYSPENIPYAGLKASEIKLDMLKGCFDTTLKKYEIKASKTPLKEAETGKKLFLLGELKEKFNDWVRDIRNVEITNSIDYLYLGKWVEKNSRIAIHSTAKILNAEKWAVTTYNRRLYYLNTFFSWLSENGLLESNPLKGVCKKREKGKKKCERRNALNEIEIIKFLEAIKHDTFCPRNSRFKHSHYYPFLVFLFHTGVRNAEAIGLKVKHIDLEKGQIEISETFARTAKGTNHSARISKGTKTENVRFLPLTEELTNLLILQIHGKSANDFVFLSPKGLTIDDKMLERRVFKPVMLKLELGNKDLYCARHSFGTRAVQQGMPLTDIAYLMGHNSIETASRNYVHVGRPAQVLPVL